MNPADNPRQTDATSIPQSPRHRDPNYTVHRTGHRPRTHGAQAA